MTDHIQHEFDDHFEDRAYQTLMAYKKERNTMFMSEFQKYIPIFKYEDHGNLDDDKLTELCADWMTRVDNYVPVYILDDVTKKVVMTLPPMFSRVAPVNTVKGGADVATALFNACNQPDEFNIKKERYTYMFKQAIDMANNNGTFERNKTESNKLVSKLVEQGIVTKENVTSNSTEKAPSNTSSNMFLGDADVEPL